MPNKAYVKGRKKEYKLCNRLKAEGYDIVQRTAGSHSPIDIIAISREKREVLLVQSKPEGYIPKYIKEYAAFDWLNNTFIVEFKVM